MKFGETDVGVEGTCKVVAELGQCAGDEVELAVQYARVARQSGCSFAKFQILDPARITQGEAGVYWDTEHRTQGEAFQEFGVLDRSRWPEVAKRCRDEGIEFAATPFDIEAVEVLEECDPAFIKIASGDITYKELIWKAAATGKPIVLSTGASTRDEIDQAVKWVHGRGPVLLMACTLEYPATFAHLLRIQRLSSEFWSHYTGYSDHTLSTTISYAAAAMGAVLLEKHFTLDRGVKADDGKMALLPAQMENYVVNARRGAQDRGVDGLWPTPEETRARLGARRSLCAARDIAEGEEIKWGMVTALRPGDGVSPANVERVYGRARRAYRKGEQLEVCTTT